MDDKLNDDLLVTWNFSTAEIFKDGKRRIEIVATLPDGEKLMASYEIADSPADFMCRAAAVRVLLGKMVEKMPPGKI